MYIFTQEYVKIFIDERQLYNDRDDNNNNDIKNECEYKKKGNKKLSCEKYFY